MWMQPPPPPPAAASQEPTTVAGVEVTAKSGAPKVVASYPAPGQSVAPGALVLMVRFDHRMTPGAWDYGAAGPGAPACLDRPRLLQDERTFVLMCSLGFNKSFAVQLNGGPKGFMDAAHTPAAPYALAFSTGDGEPTASVADALKAAGLADVDSPILDSEPAPGAQP